MRLAEIKELLKAEVVYGEDALVLEISTAFAVDMLSDALALAKPGCLLVTGLISPQTVRTAFALDIAAILVCRGKVPSQETISMARDLDVPILRTRYIMFESCGRLYGAGMVGCIKEVGRE